MDVVKKAAEERVKLENQREAKEDSPMGVETTALVFKGKSQTDLVTSEDRYHIEAFLAVEKDEIITSFTALKHYLIIHLKKNSKDIIKFYNQRTGAFHTLSLQDLLYDIEVEPNYVYDTVFYNFVYKNPYFPNRLFSYNMGLRELSTIYTQTVSGYNVDNITMEKVDAETKDKTKIPITFVYDKQKVSTTSCVILHVGGGLKDKVDSSFKLERVGLLDRGFIYAFPHLRGSRDLDEEWFLKGSGLQRTTNITDLIEVAQNFIVSARQRGHTNNLSPWRESPRRTHCGCCGYEGTTHLQSCCRGF
eukprot:TRINITY_DN6253_c0_g1_i1.p1 TRINITY_DN6253_c0_g1~~TRINITY_DN6253_c0_g1_i1.p1  ORF type:complete len:304 (+),score=44.78 TRINITY_DN6253_c0_g1_i1:186-1097(+)